MAAQRRRIDVLMVERGLAPTREKAQALLMAGSVTVDGRAVTKPGTAVAAEASVDVRAPLQYVGRGGQKMAGALDALGSTRRGPSRSTSGPRPAGSRTACCSVAPSESMPSTSDGGNWRTSCGRTRASTRTKG